MESFPMFQPTKRVSFDDLKKVINLEFDVNELLVPASVPQTPAVVGGYNKIFILERLKQFYNEKLKMMRGDFSEPRCNVGTGIIPLLNDNFTIIQARPIEYLTYPGKLAFSGGFLETRLLPLENAKKEFCEETLIYNFRDKILYTGNFCSDQTIEDHIKVLKIHNYDVEKIERFDVEFLKLNNMTKITAVNNYKKEESYGYVFRRPMGSAIEIYYLVKINYDFDLNNIITIATELGGELSFITPMRELLLARESYFSLSSEYALKKIIEAELLL